MAKHLFFYENPVGILGIEENGSGITKVFFSSEEERNSLKESPELKETDLIRKAAKQLKEYFAGKRKIFEFPLEPQGTEFQKKVWNALIEIPYGETRSYKEIAERVGNEKASRAVGMANNKNPIAIIIPCHRVVGANGKLIGYAGGLDKKERLLNMESRRSQP